MSDYAWFKLLVRAIGILLLGLAIPSVVWWVVQMVLSFAEWSPVATSGSFQRYIFSSLTVLLSSAVQAALGYYLLFKGEWIIARILSEIHGRCATCGYDLRGLKSESCPECNTPLRAAKSPS